MRKFLLKILLVGIFWTNVAFYGLEDALDFLNSLPSEQAQSAKVFTMTALNGRQAFVVVFLSDHQYE